MTEPRPRTWSQTRASRLRLNGYPTGFPVHVTARTHEGKPFFVQTTLADAVFRVLRSHERTLAAVLMPDHVHWILDCSEKAPRAVADFKSLSTHLAWEEGHAGNLWQRSYFDRVIRGEEGIENTIRYVLANPVRARLVENAEDYPWSYERFEILAGDRVGRLGRRGE